MILRPGGAGMDELAAGRVVIRRQSTRRAFQRDVRRSQHGATGDRARRMPAPAYKLRDLPLGRRRLLDAISERRRGRGKLCDQRGKLGWVERSLVIGTG